MWRPWWRGSFLLYFQTLLNPNAPPMLNPTDMIFSLSNLVLGGEAVAGVRNKWPANPPALVNLDKPKQNS